MISDSINKQIADALKARNEVRLSTLRMLSSALNYEKIAKQKELNEEDELVVVRRELNKRNDAIEALKQAQGRHTSSDKKSLDEKLAREKEERDILMAYLPKQLSDEEVSKLVDEAMASSGAKSIKDIGKVIGMVMGKAKGKVDGARVANMVKSKLTKLT